MRIDRQAVSHDGQVDHEASAQANLKEIRTTAKEIYSLDAVKGALEMGKSEGPVAQAALVGFTVAAGIVSATVTGPIMIAKDAVDAAVHGIVAGFRRKDR